MPITNDDLATILSRPGYHLSRDSAPVASQQPRQADSPSTPVPASQASKAEKARTRKLALAMSEADLQQSVIDLARLYGWKCAHFRSVKVQKKDGTTFWQTPVAADGDGFPDLVLARNRGEGMGRIIFAELKKEGEKPKPAQRDWLELLILTQRVEVYVLRPSDWISGKIEALLR